MVRALGADGLAPPPQNAGFLRPDAYLAIVMLTNEDDCSAPVNSALYDTALSRTLASPVGPVGNFRCNEFGHLCSRDGGPKAPPLRLSPDPQSLQTEVRYDDCVSAEDMGTLTPVATFVSEIKSLKSDPANQILVASIQGPTTPYAEHWVTPPSTDTGPWPTIEHSCDGGPGVGFADPGVRMQQFVASFGNALLYPICSLNLSPTLQTIGQAIAGMPLRASCIPGPVGTKNQTGDISQPDCTVTEISAGTGGQVQKTAVPSCATAPTDLCWQLASGDLSCRTQAHRLVLANTVAANVPTDARFMVDCRLCTVGDTNPSCP